MELEKELVRALRPLALGDVPAQAVAALFDTGGTAAAREEELAASASLRQLRVVDHVFAKYLRRQAAAASRGDTEAADPQVARLWAFLASQESVAAVVGEQNEEQSGALYRSFFTLLQSVLNVREAYANMGDDEKRSALIKALVAAKVYLAWLQLPGGSAYGLFMPYVYRQVLDILKKWVVLMANQPGEASGASKGKKNRRGRPTRRVAKRKQQSDEDESDEDGDEAKDYRRLTQYGLELLDMLTAFLGSFSLSSSKESIVPTIETAVALQTAVPPANENTATAVTSKTLELLEALVVDGTHGDTLEIARVIIHCYIPGVTFQETVAKENNCALRFHKLAMDVIARVQRLIAQATSDEDGAEEKARRESSLMRLGLLQNLCLQAPDRAEFRGRVLTYAFAIATAGRQGKESTEAAENAVGLRDEECVRLARFLASYSRNAKAKFRQFAVELIGRFVLEAGFWKVKEAELPRVLVMYSGVGPLLDVLVDRARDKNSNVRTKAIAGISATLTLGLSKLSDTEATATDSDDEDEDEQMEGSAAVGSEAIAISLQKLLYETSIDAEGHRTLEETPLMQRLIELFRERLADDKTFVRRAALQALEALLMAHSGDAVLASSRKDLFDIHGRCTDSSVVVRVQAIKSLSSILLKFPKDDEAQKLWNLGVLPLCVDPETTVQSCALDWTGKVVFDRVLAWYRARRNDAQRDALNCVWDLVSHLDGVMARCAQKALRTLAKLDKLNIHSIIQASIYAIKLSVNSYDPNEDAAEDDTNTRELTRYWGFSWVVLEELAHSGKLIEAVKGEQENLGVVVECWNKLQDQALPVAFNDGSKRILRVIAAISTVIDPQDAKSMADSILASLHSFAIPLNVIADAVLALNSICKAKANSEEKGREISFAWGKKLLELCETSLRKCFESSAEDVTEETALLQKQLISIGEVALLEFDKDGDKGAEAAGTVALVPITSGLKSLVQLFLPPKFVANTNASNQSMSQAAEEEEEELSAPVSSSAVSIPTPVRVCAFVTLGKLCLRDQDLAKKCMTMFIRELRTCPEQDIRSNILLILGDLCIRYTSLVDTYITTIALSLLDESRLLRRSALLLFSQLILQDYIKWRESLLRFFLRAAVDEDEELANLARHVLRGPLLQKSPHIFMNKFIEMIFVLNRFEGNKLKFSEPFEREGVRELALLGDARFSRRAWLYKFLLENMSDEQKLQISMKLCSEVLEDVLDGKLPLCDNPSQITDHCTEAVLKDTFAILCSPQIKLSTSKDDDEDADGEDVSAANGAASTATQLAAAKGKLLSKMSKKNFLENVVPVLIGLKHTLEAKHSPLTRYVLHYIRELFKLYRHEVKDIFMNTDPQMAMEVEYDLRQYELQQEQQSKQAQARSSRAQGNVTPTKTMSPLAQVQATGMATPAPTAPAAAAPRTPQEQLLEASHTPLRLRDDTASVEETTPARSRRRQSLPATPTPSRTSVQRREVSSDEKARQTAASPSTLIFSPSKSRPAGENGSWHVTLKSPTVGKPGGARDKKGFSQKDLEGRMQQDLAAALDSAEDSGASSDDKENSRRRVNRASRRSTRPKASKKLEAVASDQEDDEVVPLPLKKKKKTKAKTKSKTSAVASNVTMRPKRKRK